MASQFVQRFVTNEGFYHTELPPHIPRVRAADRDKVLSFLEQTRAEQEDFEAVEMGSSSNEKNEAVKIPGVPNPTTSVLQKAVEPAAADAEAEAGVARNESIETAQ